MAGRSRRRKRPPETKPHPQPQEPPEELFERPTRVRRGATALLLCLLSVLLLTLSFAPFDCWYLAYIALVPWTIALASSRTGRWPIVAAWFSGLVFWAVNLYWLTWITGVGYVALLVFLSLYWLLAAVVVRAALRRDWPTWVVLPVVWTALEYLRAYVISGFPWFFLAHTQYRLPAILQVADFAGAYGVTFFVGMVNGAIADVLTAPLFVRRVRGAALRPSVIAGPVVTAVVTVGVLGYGFWRLGHAPDGPELRIGVVQEAFPIHLGGRDASPEEIFETHRRASERFEGADCDLILWPETMLPSGLNPEVLQADLDEMETDSLRSLATHFLGPGQVRDLGAARLGMFLRLILGVEGQGGRADLKTRREYAEQMGELSRELGCPILAGGATLHRNRRPIAPDDQWVRRNSALWFDGSWRASAIYSKMHLVPFSEYVPFKYSALWLHRALRWFVPEVMSQLDPGPRRTLFALEHDGGEPVRIAAPICYEGTFARVCRRMVVRDGRKRADLLANLSNDGWFVHRGGPDEPWRGSTEHAQHLAAYCFRAVENRVPVVRSVNTGISASIDSSGRIAAELARDGKRTMVSGTLLLGAGEADARSQRGPPVLVDRRVSVYSLAGDVFALVVSAAAVVLALRLLHLRLRQPGDGEQADGPPTEADERNRGART